MSTCVLYPYPVSLSILLRCIVIKAILSVDLSKAFKLLIEIAINFDRKKNIFKLAQGEYIAPEKIENLYTKCKFVSQCFIYGKKTSSQSTCVYVQLPLFGLRADSSMFIGDSFNSSLVAVISVDPDVLKDWAASEGIMVHSDSNTSSFIRNLHHVIDVIHIENFIFRRLFWLSCLRKCCRCASIILCCYTGTHWSLFHRFYAKKKKKMLRWRFSLLSLLFCWKIVLHLLLLLFALLGGNPASYRICVRYEFLSQIGNFIIISPCFVY